MTKLMVLTIESLMAFSIVSTLGTVYVLTNLIINYNK